jgi:hypothetical protein
MITFASWTEKQIVDVSFVPTGSHEVSLGMGGRGEIFFYRNTLPLSVLPLHCPMDTRHKYFLCLV